jgi:hypothetical protein
MKRARESTTLSITAIKQKWLLSAVLLFLQLLSPFRYICYPNELFWNEEGALPDADGKMQLYRERMSPKEIVVNNSHFLTIFKKNKWLFQPDFILNMPITCNITNNKA